MAEPEPGAEPDRERSASGVAGDPGATVVRVRIDQDKCTGDGLCVTYAPDVFEFDVDGLAYVKSDDGTLLSDPGASVEVPDHLRIAVIDSADECPGDCIYVRRDDGTVVAGPE
jgi:ferredoxin